MTTPNAIFQDRTQAGKLLLDCIPHDLVSADPVVAAIPNGGIPVALPLAARLGTRLQLVLSKKIPLKGMPYVGLGAVSSDFELYNDERAANLNLPEPMLKACAEVALRDLDGKRHSLSAHLFDSSAVRDRTVILVDDGIASGYTMLSAVQTVQQGRPKQIVIASPIVSSGANRLLDHRVAGMITCKLSDEIKFVVDDYYEDFRSIDNQEALELVESLGRMREGR